MDKNIASEDIYRAVPNWCHCYPDECSCDAWTVLKNGEIFKTVPDEATAIEIIYAISGEATKLI